MMKTRIILIVMLLTMPAGISLADGTGHGSSYDIGNTRVYEDGVTATRNGSFTNYSDGSSDVTIGDFTIHDKPSKREQRRMERRNKYDHELEYDDLTYPRHNR